MVRVKLHRSDEVNQKNKELRLKQLGCFLALGGLMFVVSRVYAADIGTMASTITKTFTSITKLVTAGSYLAGLGFAVGAIMKFKAHKDNPTQITIGTPIALIFIAAALLFLPTILGVAGSTMFGSGAGSVAGPSGAVFGK